jgi:hypothetical protein
MTLYMPNKTRITCACDSITPEKAKQLVQWIESDFRGVIAIEMNTTIKPYTTNPIIFIQDGYKWNNSGNCANNQPWQDCYILCENDIYFLLGILYAIANLA